MRSLCQNRASLSNSTLFVVVRCTVPRHLLRLDDLFSGHFFSSNVPSRLAHAVSIGCSQTEPRTGASHIQAKNQKREIAELKWRICGAVKDSIVATSTIHKCVIMKTCLLLLFLVRACLYNKLANRIRKHFFKKTWLYSVLETNLSLR